MLILSTACTSNYPKQDAPEVPHPWTPSFEPPTELATWRVRLEPLHPSHVELDFAAITGSREHLQRTLQWGDWPREGFTVSENRRDLVRHWNEFENREAYAYTVLTPDGSRCVGCIYVVPGGRGPRWARLAFWVVEDQLAHDLDLHLAVSVLGWFKERWPLDMVVLPVHSANERGARLLTDLGLSELESPVPQHRLFAWRRTM